MMSLKKWLTPRNIVGGCLLLLITSIGGCGALFFAVFSLLKSSDAYKTGLDAVQESEAVADIIGEPVQAGFWLSGSVEVNGPSGAADIAFPVKGPEGAGTVYVVGQKSAGVWDYSTIQFASKDSDESVDLLAPSE
ncbi:MAG: cytochrome c oxidase assembly factor Coa1 family protein [Cyanobacteria bacterium P01_G01_bin.54]